MTAGIARQTATAGRLVPGGRGSQTTASSGSVASNGADDVAKFFCAGVSDATLSPPRVTHTDIQDISPTAGVQSQGRIAGGAVLALEFPNIFIEASLMGHMGAGELKDPLSAQSMFKRFFTDSTLAANKSSLTTIPGPVNFHHAGHIASIRGTSGCRQGTFRTVHGRTAKGAKRA